jgi:hypothetical protein
MNRASRTGMLLGTLFGLSACLPAFAETTPPAAPATAAQPVAPAGWIKAGSMPAYYEVGTDADAHHQGKSSGYIRSTKSVTGGFGTLMQSGSPTAYLGKRVRMTAWVMTAEVGGWAGLWMRVDGPDRGKSLAFDNMQSRPIKGTTPWTSYSIVLDVPKEATQIAFGVLIEGAGEAWLDDLRFEIVDGSVPLTDTQLDTRTNSTPTNLDFER